MARRQSSTIYYKGSNHKEIYYGGHYHDKMYLGSQLVWEKLDGAIKWHGKIIDFCVFQNETYVIIKSNLTIASDDYTDRFIGKFDRSISKFTMLKKIKTGVIVNGEICYPEMISACEDGIIIHYYSNYASAMYIVNSNLTTELQEVKENVLTTQYVAECFKERYEDESGTSAYSHYRIYAKDYYIEPDYIDVEMESTYYHYPIFRKYDYSGNLIISTQPNALFKAGKTFGKINCFVLNGSFCIADQTKDGEKIKIIKTTDFSDTNVISLQTEVTGAIFYLNTQFTEYYKHLLITDGFALISGKYKKDNLYYPCIYKFDGDNLTIEMTLTDEVSKSEGRAHPPFIYKSDQLFIIAGNGAVYIGESLEKLKRITYEDTSGYLMNFKNIACDEKNIYVTAYTALYMTYTQLVISKETLEITETKSEEIYKGV